MRSIVSCPGCQRRLRLSTDQPGKKLRCPACQTPFVLGARTNTDRGGPPEFLAFELFEADAIVDGTDVVVESAAKSKPRGVRIIRVKPSPIVRPRPAPPRRHSLDHTGDIILDGFEIGENKTLPNGFINTRIPVDFQLSVDDPAAPGGLIPDEIRLLDDDGPKLPRAPRKPAPKPPLKPIVKVEKKAEARPKPSPPNPPPPPPRAPAKPAGITASKPPKSPWGEPADTAVLDLPADINLAKNPSAAAPPVRRPPAAPPTPSTPPKSAVSRPPSTPPKSAAPPAPSAPPTSAAPPPPPKRPAAARDNFEIALTPSAPAQPPATPKSPAPIEEGFEIVRPPGAAARAGNLIEADFEIVARPAPSGKRSAVPVIHVASAADVAALESTRRAQPPARPADRDRSDDEDRDNDRRERKREEMRRGWIYVFWGLTSVIVSMGMTALALVLLVLGAVGAGVGLASASLEGAASGGIIVLIAGILFIGQEIAALVGYGLCLGAPTRANARGWAITTMVLALVILVLQGVDVIGRNATAGHIGVPLIGPITGLLSFSKWFCFLFFLKAVGEGLRERWIEDEVWSTLKFALIVAVVIVMVTILSCGLGLILGVGIAASARSGDPSSALGAAGAVGIIMLLMGLIVFILAAVVWVKYFLLLLHVRSAVRARLER